MLTDNEFGALTRILLIAMASANAIKDVNTDVAMKLLKDIDVITEFVEREYKNATIRTVN